LHIVKLKQSLGTTAGHHHVVFYLNQLLLISIFIYANIYQEYSMYM